jgi:hypothetical protein
LENKWERIVKRCQCNHQRLGEILRWQCHELHMKKLMIQCFLDSSFMVGHRDRKLKFKLFPFPWLQSWSFVHLNPSLSGFVGKHAFPVFLLPAGFCVHWKSDCMNEIDLQNCSLKCMTHSRCVDYLPITTTSVKMSLECWEANRGTYRILS